MGKKAGFVAIVGKPNAGKSTLMNAIMGQTLSIVTPKPQTTRNKIFGIYTKDDAQIIFVDTPGILKPQYKLQVFMKRELESSFLEADIIILICDASKYDLNDIGEVYEKYKKEFSSHKVFCLLNKIDLLNKEVVLHIIKDVSTNFKFDEIIPLSAAKGFNVDELVRTIINYLPEHEFYFDGDIIASQPEKFFVSELIRAEALKIYEQEVPFSVYVEVDEFKERSKGKDYIRASIILEKDSQKKIVIGRNGLMIKTLGERARAQIEEFLGRKVFLELYVKIRKNWKNDEDFLKRKYIRSSMSIT
ncbi:MAG: GTPase Era [Ignavibacteria bacterium]|jgi:GTP-binding protein Era